MLRKLTRVCVRYAERYIPNPYLYAVILTFITVVAALIFTPSGAGKGGGARDDHANFAIRTTNTYDQYVRPIRTSNTYCSRSECVHRPGGASGPPPPVH